MAKRKKAKEPEVVIGTEHVATPEGDKGPAPLKDERRARDAERVYSGGMSKIDFIAKWGSFP